MLYDFSLKGSDLKSAMLTCYESRIEEEHDEETEGEVLPFDPDLSDALPKWIRMDFTRRDGCNSIHSECHLHIAGFPDTGSAVRECSYLPTDGLNRRHHRARRFGARRQRNKSKGTGCEKERRRR